MFSARLRPLVVALSAVVLAAAAVSPAIALAPSTAGSVATAQAGASTLFLALAGGSAASASGVVRQVPAARPTAVRPTAPKAASTTAARPTRATREPAPTTFHGTNHVWIPALGVSRGVSIFPCSRQQAPANYVYRWGCAGTNNVYLLGHAYGVFKALHDAYYNGRLKVGLTVIYANASGAVHTYRVTWWRVVKPTTAAKWAWASLASPSMTLQTCLGAHSEYRLMIRLLQVH
jgi:sortase (surface protein transpeptidase)